MCTQYVTYNSDDSVGTYVAVSAASYYCESGPACRRAGCIGWGPVMVTGELCVYAFGPDDCYGHFEWSHPAG